MPVEPLFKTTVVIWTDYDPSILELDELAREAVSGDAYCSHQETHLVDDPTTDPNWDGTEFFDSSFYDKEG